MSIEEIRKLLNELDLNELKEIYKYFGLKVWNYPELYYDLGDIKLACNLLKTNKNYNLFKDYINNLDCIPIEYYINEVLKMSNQYNSRLNFMVYPVHTFLRDLI